MSYPIRYRFKDRKTGKVVKHIKGEYIHNNISNLLMLYPNGNPCVYSSDGYDYVNATECKFYILEVALEKDEAGNWIYKQVGD